MNVPGGDDVLIGGGDGDGIGGEAGHDRISAGARNDFATAGSCDVCNGQQGTDFAVEETCEQENQIEVTGPFPEG